MSWSCKGIHAVVTACKLLRFMGLQEELCSLLDYFISNECYSLATKNQWGFSLLLKKKNGWVIEGGLKKSYTKQ